jgi:hypothetical protein
MKQCNCSISSKPITTIDGEVCKDCKGRIVGVEMKTFKDKLSMSPAIWYQRGVYISLKNRHLFGIFLDCFSSNRSDVKEMDVEISVKDNEIRIRKITY